MTDASAFVSRGRCWRFGDNVCNDGDMVPFHFVIAREQRPQVLKDFAMTGLDPDFPKKARPGDIVVAGRRFAHGNAHIQAFIALKGLGLSVAVESIPRGSLRNAVNAGVLILPACTGITREVETGDELQIDFASGRTTNFSRKWERTYPTLPTALLEIVARGGWEQNFRARLAQAGIAPR
jgi:3-isopropylmalate/(R)-2-methylmalate dehydratase small subunit